MLCLRFPFTPVHCCYDRALVPHSVPLKTKAIFFDYVIIDGKRFYASRSVGTNRTSLSHVIIPGEHEVHAYGEILEIFQIDQTFSDMDRTLWFTRMRWFMPVQRTDQDLWTKL
jgi:hypothetical protein